MTNGEYQDLVRFLGERFAEIDGRFAQIDARFAQIDARFAQIDTQFAAVGAQFVALHREIRQVADAGEQKLQEFRAEVRDQFGGVRAEFDEVKGLIRVGYIDLDRRVRRLEEGR